MIARVWTGWTSPQNADSYEHLLRTEIFPGIRHTPGHRGAYLLRHDGPAECEFVVINLFDSLDAVRAFAGPDYTVAVIEPQARALLSRTEPVAHHYEVAIAP